MKYFGLFLASFLGALLVGWLLKDIGVMLTLVFVLWLFYGIYQIRWTPARWTLYVVATILVVWAGWFTDWFKEHLPLASRSVSALPQQVDVGVAKKTVAFGVEQEGDMLKLQMDLDSLHNVRFSRQLGLLQESVKQGRISPDSALKILADSIGPSLSQYQAEQARVFLKAATPKRVVSAAASQADRVTYNVKDEELEVVDVPPYTKVVLTATTAGYICDPAVGLISSADGGTYLAAQAYFGDNFVAPKQQIFCILAQLNGGRLEAFENNACTLYNDSDNTQTCSVKLNERDCGNCWDDNTGTVQIRYTLVAL